MAVRELICTNFSDRSSSTLSHYRLHFSLLITRQSPVLDSSVMWMKCVDWRKTLNGKFTTARKSGDLEWTSLKPRPRISVIVKSPGRLEPRLKDKRERLLSCEPTLALRGATVPRLLGCGGRQPLGGVGPVQSRHFQNASSASLFFKPRSHFVDKQWIHWRGQKKYFCITFYTD